MEQERIILYTWQDVERYLLMRRQCWPDEWIDIEVFSSEIIIYVKEISANYSEITNEYFKKVLRQYYDNMQINIPVTGTIMNIILEIAEDDSHVRQPFPLFKDFLYTSEENDASLSPLPGKPIVAFHSYKGGVGRTLSLITFVRDIIDIYGSGIKLLIVDGDMEAPGLTWLGMEQNENYSISYIDFLNIISVKGLDENVFQGILPIIENSRITFQNSKMTVDQYFLPTYRVTDQLLDIYSKSERIMTGEKNKYIISDALSRIGEMLNVDMVVVDLRAGISEYSAPFLFDPRVRKILVSSTSRQSVVGTNLLLQQLRKQKDNSISKILLTMVQEEMLKGKEKDELIQLLLQETKEEAADDVDSDISKLETIIEIPKNESVIHLGNLEQICNKLNGANNVTEPITAIVQELLKNDEELITVYTDEQIQTYRNNLYQIANDNVTAEGTNSSNLLITKPVMQLGNFTKDIPKITILGAKGSGKTYLYKQMIASKYWRDFLSILGKSDYCTEDTLICPVLCTEDRSQLQKMLGECRKNCLENITRV